MAAVRVPSSGTTWHPSSSTYFWASGWERVNYTYYITGDMLSTGKMQYKATVKIYFRYDNTWMSTGYVIKLKFTVGDGTSGWVTAKAWDDYWEGTGPHKTLTLTAEATPSALTLPWSIEWSDSGTASGLEALTQTSKAKASGNIAVANGPSSWSLSNSTINIGSSFSATMSKLYDTNYHTFTLTSGSNSKTYGSSSSSYDTSATLAVSASDVGSWFSSTSTSLSATLTLHTYMADGTLIGSSDKSVTINMTQSVGQPTGLTLSNSTPTKGQIKFTITAPTCKYGATISSYTCTPSIGSASRSGTTVTVTIPSGASASSVTLTVVAKDSRGYEVSAAKSVTYNGKSLCAIVSSAYLNDSVQVTADEWVASNTISISASSKNSSGTATTVSFASKSTSNAIMCNFSAANFGYLFPTNSKTTSSTITFTTYNSGGTSQGSDTATVSLTMPESVGKPTGMKLTIASSSNTQIQITVTPPSYKYGASLSKYTVTTSSGTASVSGNTITISNSSGFGNGKVTVSVYATDTRGFKTDTISIEKLNTVPKIVLGGVSYEKVCYGSTPISAIYLGSTKVM